MATVTTSPVQDREQVNRRVAHPLQRLRATIRLYVGAEGLAVLLLYLALWFWISLLLDFGFFKAFAVDWVQELPLAFRAILLGGLVTGLVVLVTLRVVLRLFREFADKALALVLERRFPNVLGDRLITAVELADPAVSERHGYSPAMVSQTIREAADRVEQMPVREVFNWRRLRRQGIAVALLTLGIYVVLALGYCVLYRVGPGDFAARFNSVAAMWFERNVLLAHTLWPRRAHLELVSFPESGELRIGRNAPPPTLRVRAFKWVVAADDAPEGWRALRWDDLNASLLGTLAPPVLPRLWEGLTVDEIELQLDKPEIRDTLSADTVLAVRSVLEQLEAQAASPAMTRRLRQLTVPDAVEVLYQGETLRSEQRFQKQLDNEYAGVLSDLKESVRFTVRGEDYYTPTRFITLVPPPTLVELTRDEYQPAYLYHRLTAGADPSLLRGQKQEFRDQPVSLGGSASQIGVPAGTDVILRARTDKPLRLPDGVRLRETLDIPVTITQPDDHSFRAEIRNLTAPVDLTFEFTDTDNVIGWRQVVIRPIDDLPPEADVLVEVIRKTNQGYLVTPLARIPFSGKVRDDHGLQDVEFAYTVAHQDGQAGLNATPVVSLLQLGPAGPVAAPLAAAYLGWLARVARTPAEEARPADKLRLAGFVRRLQERAEDHLTPGALPQRLKERPSRSLFRDHSLDPVEEIFDVEKLGLRASDEKQVQPHYRLRLWLVATDNNVETGPGVGHSKERFTFLVVSENELLAEIAKEEESLHLKLEDTVNRLKETRTKLEQVIAEVPRLKPDEFSPMARRTEEVTEVVVRAWDITREVHADYRRILKELQANRVQPGIITRVERNICDPLDLALNQEYVRADEALRAFHKVMEERKTDPQAASQARTRLDELIERLTRVLDAMGDVTTINKLIALLVEVEKGERKEYDRLKQLRDNLQEKILDDVLTPTKPK